jgi:Txe/YoeB family toxin of Txe-Axe toxin-antitoxin module
MEDINLTPVVVNNGMIPKRVFIVPYRNRCHQKFFFCKYMSFIMEGIADYEIYFSHQYDKRSFNRGATKNIGFLAIKQKYPNDYKNITLIFNDVDTVPFKSMFDYETTVGVVKHYYGFTHTLGGIVVIKASDFERVNGFPNFWGYGMEDNCLQTRCQKYNLSIDRSVFFPVGSPEILQLFDGITRIVNSRDPLRMKYDDGIDGIKTIHRLVYTIDLTSKGINDNVDIVNDLPIFYINIYCFYSRVLFESENYYNYDLRDPPRKISHPDSSNLATQMVDRPEEEWKHIPHHATRLCVKTINTPHPSPQTTPPPQPQQFQNNIRSRLFFKRMR